MKRMRATVAQKAAAVRRVGLARQVVLVAVLAGLGGCASRDALPETVEPAVAESAVRATAPDRPLRIVFQWRIMQADARFSGQGAGRVQPPLRARLDLFGPGGNAVLSAALVGDDLRLPPGVPPVQLPPPALMWAALGVVAPPDRATLVGTSVEPARTRLYYQIDEGRLRYTLEGDQLTAALWETDGRRMVVDLSGTSRLGLPGEALYRDPSGPTELMLNLEQVDEAEPYPPDTWQPGR